MIRSILSLAVLAAAPSPAAAIDPPKDGVELIGQSRCGVEPRHLRDRPLGAAGLGASLTAPRLQRSPIDFRIGVQGSEVDAPFGIHHGRWLAQDSLKRLEPLLPERSDVGHAVILKDVSEEASSLEGFI